MATRLNSLKLKELSLVDNPANKAARVTIFKRAETDAGASAGDPPVGKKETPMSDDAKKVADLEASVADLNKKLEEATASIDTLKAEKETAEKIAKLSADERAHYDKLDDDGKAAFLKLSDNDRKNTVAKAADADAVIYKADDGTEYRKSDDPRLVELAKRADADRKEAREAREAHEMADLRKRADDEFGHVPGDTEARAKMLKAMNEMDEDLRKAFEAVFTQSEKLAKAGFDRAGHGNGQVAEGSAEDRLDKMAKEHASKNDVSFAKAYDEVLKTEDGSKLYNEMLAEKQPAAS